MGIGVARLKILHVSDVHCSEAMLRRALRELAYDVVVVSGDLECPSLVDILGEAGGDVVVVTGNMDSGWVREELASRGYLLDGRTRSIGGLVFAGIGGIEPYGDAEKLRVEVDEKLLDVLVSHHPPYGVLDESAWGGHGGLLVIRRLVEGLQPLLHLFGHIHEARGQARLGATLAVNPGPLVQGYYAVIEVSDGKVEARLGKL
ncbi:metallophosphoesterase family protein [Hyperthermus butylicus]|uniref:metallophosphoesterase family protein n=1 Tax=Hyperthermus butylicus TaxID=54248 RepID=UPI00068A11A2|nr:metallophosphoesterase family protein [Hyperthermus butylicus]